MVFAGEAQKTCFFRPKTKIFDQKYFKNPRRYVKIRVFQGPSRAYHPALSNSLEHVCIVFVEALLQLYPQAPPISPALCKQPMTSTDLTRGNRAPHRAPFSRAYFFCNFQFSMFLTQGPLLYAKVVTSVYRIQGPRGP